MPTFQTLLQLNGKTATGFEVPEEVVTGFGKGKKPAVRVTINGYTYRSTIAPYSGVYMLGVSAENREGAGVAAGDTIEVTLELDTEPRVVDVPPDFAGALDSDADAKRFFESLPYSNKRRLVLAIDDAKTAETRQRRIASTVDKLREEKA
jgi:hypothetical protein